MKEVKAVKFLIRKTRLFIGPGFLPGSPVVLSDTIDRFYQVFVPLDGRIG